MKKLKIYIASPYTAGDRIQNIRLQIDAFHILRDLGYIPIPPLISHYINEIKERSHADWIAYDFEILAICNLVVRIRPKDNLGIEIPSPGADMEIAEAKRLNIPFYEFSNLDDLNSFFILNKF